MKPKLFLLAALYSVLHGFAQPTGFYFSPISQGSEPSSPARLQVVRCCTAEFPAASVMLVTADSTAKAGFDYVTVNTNLTFAAGETTHTVEIPVLNDALIEEFEVFHVFLTNAVGYPLSSESTSIP